MTNKKILISIMGLISGLMANPAVAEQCPAINEVVINGKLSVPHGWNDKYKDAGAEVKVGYGLFSVDLEHLNDQTPATHVGCFYTNRDGSKPNYLIEKTIINGFPATENWTVIGKNYSCDYNSLRVPMLINGQSLALIAPDLCAWREAAH